MTAHPNAIRDMQHARAMRRASAYQRTISEIFERFDARLMVLANNYRNRTGGPAAWLPPCSAVERVYRARAQAARMVLP